MHKLVSVALGLQLLLFGAFSSSTTYQLNSYGIGSGGTNGASSSTYKLQGNAGEQSNGSTAGTTYRANNGAVQTEQLNVPAAPTLSNGSNTYYNKLGFTVNTSGNPADTTYSVAVSTNNFVTTTYVQADGTLGASPVYQAYSAWGGAGGSLISSLQPGTAYKVKVDAMQGVYTNTAYGAAATASTVTPSITFSVSPNTASIGSLLPGSIFSSPNLTFGLTTNAVAGGGVYVSGQSGGLHSATQNHTISAFSGDLTTQSEGFGIQVFNATQTSGGPFSAQSPFNGGGTNVGAESSVPQQLLSSAAPLTGGSANGVFKAKASALTPTAADYQEILIFLGTANF